MRGKAKQRVSLILVVTMVLGTVLTGNTVFAAGESSDEQDRIKINISKDSEQTVEQNVTQTIHVTAQGQCSQSVCLNVYLKNEDGSAATDIDAVNLLTSDQLTDKNTQETIDETLKDSVTLNNGTKASPTAEWKNDKDDNGTVTSKYLQITMPADATAINFDMQLQYRTDEASYTKKVLVEAKAFEEEQDITEADKREDESKENETTTKKEYVTDENGVKTLVKNEIEKTKTTFTENEATSTGTHTETIINKQGFELPITGGMGTVLFSIAGFALMAGAAFVLLKGRRKDA